MKYRIVQFPIPIQPHNQKDADRQLDALSEEGYVMQGFSATPDGSWLTCVFAKHEHTAHPSHSEGGLAARIAARLRDSGIDAQTIVMRGEGHGSENPDRN